MASRETSSFENRFRSLSRLAVEAAAGALPDRLLEQAVTEAVATMGLVAGAVRIYGTGDVDLIGAVAGEPAGRTRIQELERTLLADLRHSYSVRSLYMTLDLDGPSGLFSYPLRSGDTVIGNISGVSRGERNLAVEEEFVASLAAMIVLIGRSGKAWTVGEYPPTEAVTAKQESEIRTATVLETAAAVNHEINNPLMALVGNLELLLRRAERLDPDTITKLDRMREAAERIRTVTHNLMRIRDVKSVPYPGGGRMIDIDGSPKSEDE
ncbi:MAG TPA: histidine kinase dimerization/phospho-acceptor domain-containing protein [Acidobacteriota bacterium]|nr:histidine kinase dimerization/phospho-acceptor domain-containing protein [Acidobacteriota bacterium]